MIREGIEKAVKGKHRKIKISAVWDWDNLVAAEKEARKGKGRKHGVRRFDAYGVERGLKEIQQMLQSGSFRSSDPTVILRKCPCGKTRELTKVPYFPDHIVHHALMRVIGGTIDKALYGDSFAGVKERGIHKALYRVHRWVDVYGYAYFAKTDFKKFYASINQELCYLSLCRLFHDKGIRLLLREVLTVREHGLGIGLYPVQAIANYYLDTLARGINRRGRVHVFSYCDDLLLIGRTKKDVWQGVDRIRRFAMETGLGVHDGTDVNKVTEQTSIDFVGYRVFTNRTAIRKRIKMRMKHTETHNALISYRGWLQHCNGRTLWQKIKKMKKFSDLGIKKIDRDEKGRMFFDVPMVKCEFLKDRTIVVKNFQADCDTRHGDGRYAVLCSEGGRDCKFLTNNPRMKNVLDQCREMEAFPFEAVLRCRSLGGNKTDYYFE